MSKKLAEGSDALVLDVKCGDGAFMKDLDARARWPHRWSRSARQAGVRTEAVITDMDAPLGRAVGNALEIVECLETLKGKGPTELADGSRRISPRGWWCSPGRSGSEAAATPSGCRGACRRARARDIRADDRAPGRRPARRGRLFAAAVSSRPRDLPGAASGLCDGAEGRGHRARQQRPRARAGTRSRSPSTTASASSCAPRPANGSLPGSRSWSCTTAAAGASKPRMALCREADRDRRRAAATAADDIGRGALSERDMTEEHAVIEHR